MGIIIRIMGNDAKNMKTVLGDIADIVSGYPFRGSIPERLASNTVVVQPKNTSSEEGIDYKSCMHVELTGKKEPEFLISTDLLINARSEPFHSVIVSNGFEELNLKAVSAPYFFVIKVKSKDISPLYLSWFLNQHPAQTYFQKNSEGSMTKSLRREILESCPVSFPSLERQTQIMELVANLKRQKSIYEQLIQQGKLLEKQIAADLANSQFSI